MNVSYKFYAGNTLEAHTEVTLQEFVNNLRQGVDSTITGNDSMAVYLGAASLGYDDVSVHEYDDGSFCVVSRVANTVEAAKRAIREALAK